MYSRPCEPNDNLFCYYSLILPFFIPFRCCAFISLMIMYMLPVVVLPVHPICKHCKVELISHIVVFFPRICPPGRRVNLLNSPELDLGIADPHFHLLPHSCLQGILHWDGVGLPPLPPNHKSPWSPS